jgi:hemoglobin
MTGNLQTDASSEIDKPMIERLVRAFYGRARLDPLIGPVFEAKVHDWDAHIWQICDFWSSILLKSGRYRGQPMMAHIPLALETAHFDRWLKIFMETTRELCPPDVAAQFLERAYRIAESLELGIVARSEHIGKIIKRSPPI